MRWKEVVLDSPLDNVLYDEVLLDAAETGRGGEVLRVWESPVPFIVLGRVGDPDEELDREAVCRDRIPVVRRGSGGGTVLQGPGCLNVTWVLSKDRDPRLNDLKASYRLILDRVREALREVGVVAEFRPLCDLVLPEGERKCSGNAQRRGRRYLLHHGTILYDFDLERIPRYLRLPSRMPDYRRGRTHACFVANAPCDPVRLRCALRRMAGAIGADTSPTEEEMRLLRAMRTVRAGDRLVDLDGGE